MPSYNTKAKPSVLLTFDSMKNSNTGYYYFGKGLGNSLIRLNEGRYDFNFYLHKRTRTNFNNAVNIIRLSKFHHIYFPYRNNFDLVHFTDQECRLRPCGVNARKIMTIHDINRLHIENPHSKELVAYIKRLRGFIAQVDHVVAISHFVAKDVKKLFPEAADKLTVIYNGADKLSTLKDYIPPIAPKGNFLFTIGVLTPQKGFQYLPCLLENNSLNLVIAGIETPHKSVILEQAEKYGCRDRVFITGPITDAAKAWYYQNCEAFVFPSIAEGFGLPVIEAMYFGKPVFLANRTSLPEIGGDAAYYFDSFEPHHMREVLNKGLQDFKSNNRTEDVIKQAEKFTWGNAANSYLELYNRCLSIKKTA